MYFKIAIFEELELLWINQKEEKLNNKNNEYLWEILKR